VSSLGRPATGPDLETLRAAGYTLLPLPPRSKNPPPVGWPNSKEPYPIPGDGNVAIGTRGELAILVTNDDDATTWAREKFGPPHVRSKRGGHWYFRAREGQANEASKVTSVGLMEYHARNKYALIPPSIHPSGTPYRWERSLPRLKDLPEAPDLRDLFHPGGTHHDQLLRMSAAKAHAGAEAETILAELVTWRDAHLTDPQAHPERELRPMAKSAVAKFHAERPPKESAVLFRDLVGAWKAHVYLPLEWEYHILALFTLQSRLAPRLPGYFYLLIGGEKGTGKTTILDHVAEICRAFRFQNVSLASLARKMDEKDAPTVCIDEFDVSLGEKDLDNAMNALVRQGYKRNAAPFTRCISHGQEVGEFRVNGPKALTFAGKVEDALQDRGFFLPAEKGKDYSFVLRAFSPKWGDLPSRLDAWAATVLPTLNPDALLARLETKDFQSGVERVLGVLQATRNAELVTIALLVAEAAGVNLEAELQDALTLKEAESEESEWVDALGDVVRSLATTSTRLEESEFVVVRQRDVKVALDAKRKESRLPPSTTNEFAAWRRKLGVRSGWLRKPKRATYWHLPQGFVDGLGEVPPPTSPTSPTSPAPRDGRVSQVSQVRWGGEGPQEEDLLGPGPTLADRALANVARNERERAVPDDPVVLRALEDEPGSCTLYADGRVVRRRDGVEVGRFRVPVVPVTEVTA
jgi:hypothetical protein